MSDNEMRSGGSRWPVVGIAGGGVLVLALLLSFAVDTALGRAIVAGLVGSLILIALYRFWRWLFSRSKLLGVVAVVLPVAALVVLVVISLLGTVILGGAGGTGSDSEVFEAEEDDTESPPPPLECPIAVVTAVNVVIEAEDLRGGTLAHGGTVTAYEPQLVTTADGITQQCAETDAFDTNLTTTIVEAERQGMALREVRISSRAVSAQIDAALGPDARYPSGTPVTVEVVDVPKGSFFEARDSREIEIFDYLGSQTITWQQRSTSQSVVFSYIPPGWRFARPVLAAWYKVGSVGNALMGLGSLLVSLIVVPLLGDTLSDQVRDAWRKRKTASKSSKPAP